MNNHQESTYALLVRSEEKSRGVLETLAYGTIILSVVVSIWQFAHHPVRIPGEETKPGVTIATEVAKTNSPT
jgi:hypothetical protein